MATRVARKLETTEPKSAYKTITVAPLTPVIGAEIGAVDLSKPLSDDQISEIRSAHADYHVILFRDQKLSNEDHKRFARRVGTVHVHPYNARNAQPDHA